MAKPTKPQVQQASLLDRTVILLAASLLFLAPIKFASVISSVDVSLFVNNLPQLILGAWPPFLLPVATSVLLALALLAACTRSALPAKSALLWFIAPPAALLLATATGYPSSAEAESARQFSLHLVSVTQLALAVLFTIEQVPHARKILLVAVCAGGLVACGSGWLQMTGGLEQNAEQTLQLAKLYGWDLPPQMLDRLQQKRLFGTFTYPNSYAAHLLLLLPLLLTLAIHLGRQGTPPTACAALLCLIVLAVCSIPLYKTGSRGAFAGALFSLLAMTTYAGLIWRKTLWRHKNACMALAGLVIIVTVAGAKHMQQRGFRSGEVRLDYYATALHMARSHPVTGIGSGEFFPWYLRLKLPGAEDTRMPHNLPLLFLAENGIIGAIAALFFLAWPAFLAELWRRGRLKPKIPIAAAGALAGMVAWCGHSILDFNIRTPATVFTFAILPLLVFQLPQKLPAIPRPWLTIPALTCLALIPPIQRWPAERTYALIYASNSGFTRQSEAPYALLRAQVFNHADKATGWPYPWSGLGRIALKHRDLPTAQACYAKAVQSTPQRAAFHAAKANIHAAHAQWQQALNANSQACQWYPYNPRYRAQRTVLTAMQHHTLSSPPPD